MKRVEDGLYVFTHDGSRDKLIIKGDNIDFPSEDDQHNLDMFPKGKMSEYTKNKLQHYINTSLLKLVK